MIRSTLLICALGLSMTGCMTSPDWTETQRPKNWGMQIEKQHNFYKISDWVYRSEQPNSQLLEDLQAHHIQTVINLRSRNTDAGVFPAEQFNLVHIPVHTWAISREDLLQVMKQLQLSRQKNQKVLIHCYHGSDRTGASIAMYRIIFEGWDTANALNEMKHGGYGFHPIWQNIEALFSPENIKWIRQQLADPS
ncbi:dual specificity protein phosphatase family protein [Acinetobacter tianfuensis]|uniref:Protein tyrosine phosphatase n=1 Tax=Acinetobacter tianfuensis TaxID=2419603 RepID=A0A3A8EVM1_9GAMM|nr:dual specificity protein phosphatase family protein [Acinetobacter tianfuensis]RKG32473.1 protein tyrosine phosphatase [Acinetobacter tianfuensis]